MRIPVLCFLTLPLLVLASGARAQTAPEVTWLPIGPDSARVEALALPMEIGAGSGVAPYPRTGPAYASLVFPRLPGGGQYEYRFNLYRLDDPDGGGARPTPSPAWTEIGRIDPRQLYADASGMLLSYFGTGPYPYDRSTDGGATWHDIEQQDCKSAYGGFLATAGPGREGAIFTTTNLVCRSDDRGATWRRVVTGTGIDGTTLDLAEVPVSASFPRGRLVAAVRNGIAVSDDDGVTWAQSSLWLPYRWYAHDLAIAADASHPFGGTLYASVRDFYFEDRGYTTVWASEDAGSTWELRHRFSYGDSGIDRINDLSPLISLPDGSLVLGLLTDGSARGRDLGLVVWSGDGGRTWEPLGGSPDWLNARPPVGECGEAGGVGCPDGVWPGWGPNHLAVDAAGRIWVGTSSGVWRTAGPGTPVDAEDDPDSARLGVRVFPNPTGGAVTVSVTLAVPMDVAITILDVQGRVIQEIYGGGARDGQRFEIDAAGLAPGAYVVRIASASGTATAGLTVAR